MRVKAALAAAASVLVLVAPVAARAPTGGIVEHRTDLGLPSAEAERNDGHPDRARAIGHGTSRGSPSHPRGHGGHRLPHHRDFHGRFFIGGGPFFSWGPFWWYPRTYVYEPPVVVTPPPVYIQQSPPPQPYWYYCPTTRAYYPSVPTCDVPWVLVPPSTP